MITGPLVQLLIHSISKDTQDKQEEMKIPHIMVQYCYSVDVMTAERLIIRS